MRITHRLGALIFSLMLPVTVSAQWPAKYPPESTPYWWTLTPELKPQELRRILLDKKEHQRRYAKLADEGKVESVPADQLAALTYFVDGNFDPHLFRLSEAFDAFTEHLQHRPENWAKEARGRMSTSYAISGSAIETLFDAAQTKLEEEDSLVAATRDLQIEFVEILKQAKGKLDREDYRATLRAQNLKKLAHISGRPVKEVKKLAAAWERDVVEEVCLETLTTLKNTLSADDWSGFRSYLLHEIAPRMAIADYQDDTEE